MLLLYIGLSTSCTDFMGKNKQTYSFSSPNPTMKKDSVNCTIKEWKANPETGIITIKIKIQNNSFQPISIDWTQASVSDKEGLTCLPLKVSSNKDSLSIGRKTFYLEYKPINKIELYQKFQLHGNFKQEYFLSSTFIFREDKPLFDEPFAFSMDDNKYKNYLSNFNIDEFIIQYEPAEEEEVFLQNQINYLEESKIFTITNPHDDDHDQDPNETIPESLFITRSGSEYYLDQVLIKIAPYRLHNTFYVYFRITNRLPLQLLFDPTQIKLRVGGLNLSVTKNYNFINYYPLPKSSSLSKDSLILGLNDRKAFTLAFTSPELETIDNLNDCNLILDMAGFQVSSETSIFAQELSYKKTQKQ